MKFLIGLLIIAFSFTYCNKTTSNPVNNNIDPNAYYLKFSVNGTNYQFNGIATGGMVANTISMTGEADTVAGSYLTIALHPVNKTGVYPIIPTPTSSDTVAGAMWYNSNNTLDSYSSSAPNASGSINVDEITSTYVKGSFTLKLGKINLTDYTYTYINITGTYYIRRIA